jgi:hypothetical protein
MTPMSFDLHRNSFLLRVRRSSEHKSPSSLLQLVGATRLLSVVATHVCAPRTSKGEKKPVKSL